MAIVPIPGACANCGGGGGGADAVDVEDLLLCDVDPVTGETVGYALAVYEYDATGAPTGPPTFVIPGTNDPYVPQFALQPCPAAAGCGAPMQFCFTSSAQVDNPGRQYDLTFTLGAGFAVTGIIRDLTKAPFNVLWDVNDSTGEQFTADLEATLGSQFPGQTVTVTQDAPPACDGTAPYSIHIECLRLDQEPPTLLQLEYNGGRDSIQNAPYAETPPLDPIVQQGNYGYHLLSRQDDPGPFPGSQPSGQVNCTNVANRGWETNDISRTFEVWGQDVSGGVTPTPRGTPIQEITSDGPSNANPNTIWQTFQVTAAGNFTIRVIHGARDPGETHTIKLSTGDVDDNGTGDIINDVTNPATVYGGGAWTVFNQTVPLAPGIYTLALSSTNPVQSARGGLFTDMRAFVDAPGQVANFTNTDDVCTVESTETQTVCVFFTPHCSNGEIVAWSNTATGEQFTNAEFWAQVPAPTCCLPEPSEGGGGNPGNLVHTYLVCGQTETGPRTLSRVVITDPSGGAISEQFVDTNGALVTPSSWQPGECASGGPDYELELLCDDNGSFLRRFRYNPNGDIVVTDTALDGTTPYAPVGTVGRCGDECGVELGRGCYIDPDLAQTRRYVLFRDCSTGALTYYDDATGADVTQTIIDNGLVSCIEDDKVVTVLCDANGTPFIRSYTGAGDIVTGFSDRDLNGDPFIAVDPVGICANVGPDVEVEPLCDYQFTPAPGGAAQGTILNKVPFLRTYTYDADGALVGFVDTTTDGSTPYVPTGALQVPCDAFSSESDLELLCDQPTGVPFLRRYVNIDGVYQGTVDTTLDGTTPYVIVGTAGTCAGGGGSDSEVEILCDANGTQFLRRYLFDATGAPAGFLDRDLNFAPFAPVGLIGQCANQDAEVVIICDANGVPFLRRYAYDEHTGTYLGHVDRDLNGLPYVPAEPVNVCAAAGVQQDVESFILCDSTAPTPVRFLRHVRYSQSSGLVLGTYDTQLDGVTAFAPVGAVGICPAALAEFDVETQVLCDANNTRFLRRYVYDAETPGAPTVVNTLLDGTTAFAPVGAVGVCGPTFPSDFDFAEEVLCDDNGGFIRRFQFNSQTGVVTATTNLTLAGVAYVPVGTVRVCQNCCPIVVGEGCTNTGSGRYTAMRDTNGTITLIDSVSGATVLAANIVPCPTDDTVRTLRAQHLLVADADPAWTPAAVTGVLKSLTYTVLTGTATVTDSDGTVAAALPAGLSQTWSVSDDNVLTGPTSIDAVGGSTLVTWLEL